MQISPYHILLITLIFVLGGAFLVFYVHLYNRRRMGHIEETQRLQQKFDDELVKTQMEVQEQTLKTIATEIHDNVGQLLSLSKLTLGTVDAIKDPSKAQGKVQNALVLLDTSIKELRQLTSVLYADNLLAGGLESAVKNELNWLSRSERYAIKWLSNGEATVEIDKRKALIAFRLFQELINNIVKHAEASAISVTFEYLERTITVIIVDNGKGFDISAVREQPRGLGMTTMFKRAKMIGGELLLTSKVGVGTAATITLPYR